MDSNEQAPSPAPVPGRVWRGTLLMVIGRLWGSLCTFTALWLLAHTLSPEGFGLYTFYLALFALLDTLADFGTGQVAVQLTAARGERVGEVLAAARRIRLVTASTGVLVVVVAALAFEEPSSSWLMLAGLYPLTHVFELSATVFRNRIAWGVPVAVRALGAGLSLAFVLLLSGWGGADPAHFLCAVAAGSALANLALHAASRRHLPPRAQGTLPLRELWHAALPLGLAALCQQAYFWVDNLFLRVLRGDEELGAYNVGVRVLSVLIMVALYATQAGLPWLAREHAAGRLGRATARLGQPLFALAGLGAGALCPWAEELLGIFGPHVRQAAPALRWLLGAVAVIHVGAALMTALVAAGRMRSILAIAGTALALNVALNLALVPGHGATGAGAATLATEVSVAIGAFLALRRADCAPPLGWGWLLGPVGFAAGALLSAQLPLQGIFSP